MIIALNSRAQDSTYHHFEISASAMYWQPMSAHLIGGYSTTGSPNTEFNGYGNAIVPAINMAYYFDSNIGLSLSYNYIALEKEQAATTNSANFQNIRLGFTARIFDKSLFGLSFSTGINYVPTYSFSMPMLFSNPQGIELNTDGSTLGVFFNAGLSIRVYKELIFITSFDYTYIPVELDYNTTIQNILIEQIETTHLGGLGIQAGLGFRF
jgi:hypothetical protein